LSSGRTFQAVESSIPCGTIPVWILCVTLAQITICHLESIQLLLAWKDHDSAKEGEWISGSRCGKEPMTELVCSVRAMWTMPYCTSLLRNGQVSGR
jgi:hypothetical protein